MNRLLSQLGRRPASVTVYIAWVLSLTTMSVALIERVAIHGRIALSDLLPSAPRTLSRLEQRFKEQNAPPVAAFNRVGPPVQAIVDPWAPTVMFEAEQHGSSQGLSPSTPSLMTGTTFGLGASPRRKSGMDDAEILSTPSRLEHFSSASN